MARNNADFEFAKNNIVGPVHFSPKKNRESIERNGLQARLPQGAMGFAEHYGKRLAPKDVTGVYFVKNAHAFDEDDLHDRNQDIWECTHPHLYSFNDDPIRDDYAERNSFSATDIRPEHLRRVGHVKGYTAHWHLEEHCNG
jgi:hypothetical protein